jgi:hypothetical protein
MSILDKQLKKHAPITPGEHLITVAPKTAKLVEQGALMKLTFDVHAGEKVANVSFAYDGAPSGVVHQQLTLLDKWGKAVRADLSERRIGDDWRRVAYALAHAAETNQMAVFATFTATPGKNGGVFLNLSDIRAEPLVDDADAEYEGEVDVEV